MAVAESWSPFTGFGRSVARRHVDFQLPEPRTERPRSRWAMAAVIACHRCYRKVWMAADRQREEMPYLQPGSSWNSFRILSQATKAPERSRLEVSEAFQEVGLEANAILPFLQSVVGPPGCVVALNAAVKHRWLHIPKEERRSLLLTLWQLRSLQASIPALVAGALSVGSAPVLGGAAGLERKQVEAAFGQAVATLLVELQQFAAIELTLRSSGELSPGKVDLAMSLFTAQKTQSRSTESLIVFLANQAAALRLLSMQRGVPEAAQRAILGIKVYAALANLLGLGRIKDELEDAAFEILHPEERRDLRQLLGGPEGEALVNSAVRELQEALENGQRLKDLSALRVSGRAKSPYSTWKKMRQKHLRFEEVLDRAAIRVVLDAPTAERAEELCFEVRSILAELWTIREKQKDYINNPKANGYRSLHLVAERDGQPFEVQIRTEEMHRQAEYGSCGHWEYKAGKTLAMSEAAQGAGAEIFAGLDVDGDGRIDKLELQRALRQVGVEASLDEVSDMMEVFDSDGDGTVDFREFWKALVTTWFPLVSGTHRPRKRE